jgi:hypothetical protein
MGLRFALLVVALTTASCRKQDGASIGASAEARRAEWTDPLRVAAALQGAASRATDFDSVLAVVIDEPLADHVTTHAAFADGTAGFFSSTGTDQRLRPVETPTAVRLVVRRLCETATRLRGSFAGDEAADWPTRGRLRITVVTPRGRFSREERQDALNDGSSPLAPLTNDYIELMRLLFELRRAKPR